MYLEENMSIPRLVNTRIATLTAVDYDGNRRTLGGDPVSVQLIGPLEDTQERNSRNLGGCQRQGNTNHDGVHVIDHDNGQYSICLRLTLCGRYAIYIIETC